GVGRQRPHLDRVRRRSAHADPHHSRDHVCLPHHGPGGNAHRYAMARHRRRDRRPEGTAPKLEKEESRMDPRNDLREPLCRRLSRRMLLRGGVGTGTGLLAAAMLAACSSAPPTPTAPAPTAPAKGAVEAPKPAAPAATTAPAA